MELNESEILLRIGQRIKTYRDARGWSVRELEAETGINISHLSKIENGHKKVHFMTIYRIAKALNIPLSALTDF